MSLPTKDGELSSIGILSVILGWTLLIVAVGHFAVKVDTLLFVAVGSALRGSPDGLILFIIPLGLIGVLLIQWKLMRSGSWVIALLNGALVFAVALVSVLSGA